jgi:predicted MFS family arabinose efflux permease
VLFWQGINLGIFSPTFPYMEALTSSTTSQMSTTLVWTGVASLVGAILFGALFDRYDGLGLLAWALLLQGIGMGLAPWCHALVGFQFMSAAACLFNFGIMTGMVLIAA